MIFEKYTIHPLAECFPMLEGEELQDFIQDIESRGQQEPIIVLGNQVIDGRNRLAACNTLGMPPKIKEYEGATDFESISRLIRSLNIARRHLTPDQQLAAECQMLNIVEAEAKQRKAATQFNSETASQAAKLKHSAVTLKSGEPQKRDKPAEHSRSTAGQLAERVGVSRHKAEQAIAVAKQDPEMIKEVAKGKVTLKEAVKAAKAVAEKSDPHREMWNMEKALNSFAKHIDKQLRDCPVVNLPEFREALMTTIEEIFNK
jgi:ParB-like chromosome segregation protein Spo0J